jgi:hypothetical protein
MRKNPGKYGKLHLWVTDGRHKSGAENNAAAKYRHPTGLSVFIKDLS